MDSKPCSFLLFLAPEADISDFDCSSLILYDAWTFLVLLSLALYYSTNSVIFYQFYSDGRRERSSMSL